jgi:hypothetical protein
MAFFSTRTITAFLIWVVAAAGFAVAISAGLFAIIRVTAGAAPVGTEAKVCARRATARIARVGVDAITRVARGTTICVVATYFARRTAVVAATSPV